MPDNLSPKHRLKTMRSVKSKGTRLERRLFAMIAGMGIRGWYRHADYLPGKPDVVFPDHQLVIFVDGCFWHGCPYCNRPLPETNHQYWKRKIERNIERDKKVDAQLSQAGWTVLRIWEHDLKKKADNKRLHQLLRNALKGDA